MFLLHKDSVYDFIKSKNAIYKHIKSGIDFVEQNKNSLILMSTLCELNMLNTNTLFNTKGIEGKSVPIFVSCTKEHYMVFNNMKVEDEIAYNKELKYYYLKNILLMLDNLMFVSGICIYCDIEDEDGEEYEDVMLNELLLNLIMGENSEVKITKFNVKGLEKYAEVERMNDFKNFGEFLKNVTYVDELLDEE